jgi:uncharacterized protein (DUF885 family)
MQLLRMFHETGERIRLFRQPRHTLSVFLGAFALAILSPLSACSQTEDGSRSTRRAIAQSQAIAADLLTTELAMSPETASRLGLEDQLGERAAYALDNHSQAGFERRRLVRIELLQRLRSRPRLPEAHPLRRDLSIAETALTDLIELEQFGYGRYGYDDLRPYEIDPFSGIWIEGPTLLAYRQSINSADQATAFIARLRSLSGALEDSRRRLIADRAAGIYLPRQLADETRERITLLADEEGDALGALVQTFEALTLDLPDLEPRQRDSMGQLVRTEIEERLRPAYRDLTTTLSETSDAFSDQLGISALPNGPALFSEIISASTGTNIDVSRLHARHLETTETLLSELDQSLVIETAIETADGPSTESDRGPASIPARLQWFEQNLTTSDPALAESDDPSPVSDPLSTLAPRTIWSEFAAADGFGAQAAAVAEFEGVFLSQPYSDWRLDAIPADHRAVLEYPAIIEAIRLYGWSVRPTDQDEVSTIANLRIELLASSLAAVDSGIHIEQWTLSDATDYLVDRVGVSDALARQFALRVVARPGYYSAIQIAYNRILGISERAQAVLGGDYVETEFLRTIFQPGPRPLPLIEKDVEDWYAAQL